MIAAQTKLKPLTIDLGTLPSSCHMMCHHAITMAAMNETL